MAKIFYSWMSDGDEVLNRYFIWDCLERAIRLLNREDGIEAHVAVRDTQGAQGAVDIVDEIFRRIDECDLVIADVTNIAPQGSGELVPNPNVMFEFGYALARKGEKALIAVANTAYGGPESLPFDINQRKIVTYKLTDRQDRPRVREQLVQALAGAIKTNLGEHRSARIARHSVGFRALIELLIGQTDLPNVQDTSLPARAARALELAREVGRSLYDLMHGAFSGMVAQTIEHLERAVRLAPTEENMPKISDALFWAYDDMELGSRDARQKLDLDERSRQTSLAWLRSVPDWFRDCAVRASTSAEEEVSAPELETYEKKTFDLQRLSFYGLLPAQPAFSEKLSAVAVAARKEFFTLKVKDGTNIAQIARETASAVDALLSAYKI
jgi:hypothetical protein